MVSFFGLKFKDKKKKAESKPDSKNPESKEPQVPKRIDQNTLGEGQFFGLKPKTTGVINGSIRSVSRAGTPQPARSPYADTHNLAAASMFDLGNVPSVRSGTPNSLHIRPNASELNLRTRFGENNGSVSSLGLPAPGFASRPVSRPGSSSGKKWVNPLDVHFVRATPTPPPAPKQTTNLPPKSNTEQVEGELSLGNIADAVISSVNREEEQKSQDRELEKEADRQKETARLELERLERQKSTETILAPKPASPGQPQTQSPTRSQHERQPESGSPTLQGPVFRGNIDQRPDSRNGMRANGPSPVHQGPPPTGPPTQSLPQPPGQGPSRQSPHPPAIETFSGQPEGPLTAPRPSGPGGPGGQNFRPHAPHDPNAPRGRPGPGPHSQGAQGSQGPQYHGQGPIRGPPMHAPHPNSPHTRGLAHGPPGHGSPQGPPRHGSPSQRPPFGPPQGPPRHGSPLQRHGPHGPPPPNGPRGPPHPSPYGPASQGPPKARGPHLRGPLPPGAVPQTTGPFPPGPLRGPAPYGPRSESPAHRLPGNFEHPSQNSAPSGSVFKPYRPQEALSQPQAPAEDVPETPATEQAPPEPLISSLTSPTASTSASTARSSVTDELLDQLATRAVIRDVSAKRDTLPAVNTPGHHSISMKIEELEQTLLAQQAANVEEMPQLQSPEDDQRRTSSTSSYYSTEIKDDEESEKPTLNIHPAPLRIPTPVGVPIPTGPQSPSVSSLRNDSQTSPSSSTRSNTSPPTRGRDPSLPTPDINRPSPVIDTGFNFDFGPGISTPLTPDSSSWHLSSPTTETAPPAATEEAKFSRSNIPPPLNLKFNFSPDASSRDPTLAKPSLSLLTPPLGSAPPTISLNDGRPSTSSGLAASPSFISRFPLLESAAVTNGGGDESSSSFMGIGMARGPSIREVRRPGTSSGHDDFGSGGQKNSNNRMVDSFGTGFI
ncbi:hypothetical protein QBC44DRAFT_147548 [Cladorrhinum sp. PSN332]|nr:hypothetical protein QBC44DRAFT_147548 [Cladorrhinum sp. PSN332]